MSSSDESSTSTPNQEQLATIVASDRPNNTTTNTSSVTGTQPSSVVENVDNKQEQTEVQFLWHIKWKTHTYDLLLTDTSTIGSLRQQLFNLTNVKPEHQKLMLLKVKGKVVDEMTLTSLGIPISNLQHYKFQMIGNEEKDLLMGDRDIKENLDIIDDLDVEYDPTDQHIAMDEKYRKKLHKRLAALQICLISPIRPNKKLLVLDLDYTLFDMKTRSDDYKSLKRPFTNRFLSALYPYYEFVIWSQTSWKWLEIKLTELGILQHSNYKILFVLDKTCMFSVTSKAANGESRKHQVKALQIIWSKFKEWGPHNTCHVDDLGRNFAMNPQSGLKIKPYKDAPTSRATDTELQYLTQYFQAIAQLHDFRSLDHSQWRQYLIKRNSSV